MNHFYVSPEELEKEIVTITGKEAQHLIKSLRIRPGEKVELLDGENRRAVGTVESVEKDVRLRVSDMSEIKRENEKALITLYQGVPKGSKLKQIVEKATELGVNTVVPVYTGRSVSRPSASDMKKAQKLNETAFQASKQCGRGRIPEVTEYMDFDMAIKRLGGHDLVLVAYEDEKTVSLKSILEKLDSEDPVDLALFIGPEGGFDSEEIESLKDLGAHIVSLGSRILRTETAGIAGIAQINYALEDEDV